LLRQDNLFATEWGHDTIFVSHRTQSDKLGFDLSAEEWLRFLKLKIKSGKNFGFIGRFANFAIFKWSKKLRK